MITALRTRRALALVGALAAAALVASCSSKTIGTVTQSSPAPGPSSSATPGASSSVPSGVDPALATFYGQRLNWAVCGGSFRCATLTVPLDYSQPGGATIKLAVLKLPASGQRIGSMVTDPGGPGASGVDFARQARAIFSDSLREHYDVVGFDPRGVQRSSPINCLTDQQWDDYLAADGTPDDAAEQNQLVAWDKTFTAGCASRSNAQVLKHVSTVETAKDLDILRAALGDPKLTYFGFSYGTMLGAVYADLFPTHIARMVLDGAMDPSIGNVGLAHGQAKGMELALTRFVEDCDKQSDCPLPDGTQAGLDKIQSWLDGLDSKPLPTGDAKRPLTQALGLGAIFSYLYFPAYGDWDTLRAGLQDAFDGDGSTLLQMYDERNDRNDAGHYTTNLYSAYNAISALDYPDRPDVTQVKTLADQWSKEAPIAGASLAWATLLYNYWPVPATGRPHEIHAPGSPPILVVGTTYDPATPYPWAQALAKQLSKGVLLTRVGDGHTGYGKGSDCTDQAVNHYLVSGTTPPAGTVCQ